MGRQDVGACLRDRSLSAHIEAEHRAEVRADFARAVWGFCRRTLAVRRSGKRAIALAPGGISGIYHELGVLKCLNDAFDCGIHDFDVYAGISAGAVVASCLANGIHIDEQIAKIGALDRRWGYQLRLGWRHLNLTEVPKRLLLAQKEVVKYVLRALMREDDFSVASMIGTWAYLLGPVFDNRQFEEAMRALLTRPGRTNDFRELDCELLVGATDQDLREHVIFGHGGIVDVPISVAVQASAAMHPFFPSVEINGRYFTDGMVTRTSNLGATIDRGADLVFVVDPFVPLVTDRAGHNARHGNMWIVEQDYKTMSYTRFERARAQLMRSNPQVSVYSFVPSNRMRRYMSGQNPFVARNFDRIVCAAYKSTARRLDQLEHKMSGELAGHGITLDLGPVRATCKRLGQSRRADVRQLLDEWPPRRRTDAA
jgi:predicted acylesterase/phospholipase RssA